MAGTDEILRNAKLIEDNTDKYKGTTRENPNLINVSVLLSAFSDGDYIIPVQFEIKNTSDYGGRLYLTVALTKIKADVLDRTSGKNASTSNLVSATYKIADIAKEINPKDKHFLKYCPNQMLSPAQIEAKNEALEEDRVKIESYPKKKSIQNRDKEKKHTKGRASAEVPSPGNGPEGNGDSRGAIGKDGIRTVEARDAEYCQSRGGG